MHWGHCTFWISLSLSEIAEHTHRPQGVNYHGYLHVLKYLLLLTMGHFTFWISLSLSEIAEHTHRPQGVNYHGIYMSSNLLLLL